MRTGFAKIRNGLEEHLISGRIGFFEAGVYLTIHLQADFRRGIWIGSAPRLLATAPRGASLRAVQRALERLIEIGFLRVFREHGARGNYVCLIHKYEPQFGALRGRRLNALASVDWNRPIYELVAEDDAEGDTESDTEDAPIQESLLTTHDSEKPFASEAGASDPASPFQPALIAKGTKAKPSELGQRLASLLRDRMLENNPNARITNSQLEKWGDTVDLMIRYDKRSEAQIIALIDWSQRDEFWKSNILSIGKLRDRFDQLLLKSQQGGKDGATHPGGSGYSRGNGKTPAAAHSNAIGLPYRKPSGFTGGKNAGAA